MKIFLETISGSHPYHLLKPLWTVTSPDMVPAQTDFEIFHIFIEKKSVRNNTRILTRVGPPNFGNKGHTKKINFFLSDLKLATPGVFPRR